MRCSDCGYVLRNGKNRYKHCKKCHKRYEWERAVKRKLDAIAQKGGKCEKCGYNKYYGALQFHHTDPDKKENSWSKLRGRSYATLSRELDKCRLLCANCHAEEHEKPIGEFIFAHKSWVERQKDRLSTCKQCGTKFDRGDNKNAKFCSTKCTQQSRRKVKNRPSKDKLKKLLETKTWVFVGKLFGVSDNAIRKWAKQYGLS